jgi:hypothetical protein
MSKTQKILSWLQSDPKTVTRTYGALTLQGCAPYSGDLRPIVRYVRTYNVHIAIIEESHKVAHVNVKSYSVTSSGHRNRLLEALEMAGYKITEVHDAEMLYEINEAIFNQEEEAD